MSPTMMLPTTLDAQRRRRSRATRAMMLAVSWAACVSIASFLVACDKIPGLSKKSADGAATATGAAPGAGAGAGGVAGDGSGGSGSGGGVLSFLGSAFEGEITMNLSERRNTGAPQTMKIGMKSPKARVDMLGTPTGNPALAQGGSFIIDVPAKKAYMLVPAQKRAMVIDFENAKKHGLPGAGKPGAGSKTAAVPKIEKTGTKSVVAGYECEEWKITDKASRTEMCVADGLKWIDFAGLGTLSPDLALGAALGDANRFPLRVVGFDDKGESFRMEATKVDKHAMPDAAFTVPPGYQVTDLGALMNGLPGVPPHAAPSKPR